MPNTRHDISREHVAALGHTHSDRVATASARTMDQAMHMNLIGSAGADASTKAGNVRRRRRARNGCRSATRRMALCLGPALIVITGSECLFLRVPGSAHLGNVLLECGFG